MSVFIDSYANGSLTITTYNFMKFNLLKDIGSFYGSHPWHWYLSTGFPAILGIQFLPFILASIVVLKNKESHLNELAMLGTLIFVLAVYRYLMFVYIVDFYLGTFLKLHNNLLLNKILICLYFDINILFTQDIKFKVHLINNFNIIVNAL